MSVAEPQAPACPSHPHAEAVDTCARCGRFVCSACAGGRTPARCPECAARERDDLPPEAASLKRLPALALKLYIRALPRVLLICAVGTTLDTLAERLLGDSTAPRDVLLSSALLLPVGLATEVATLLVFRSALALPAHPAPWRLARALLLPVFLRDMAVSVWTAAAMLLAALSGSIALAGLNDGAALSGQLLIEPAFGLYACAVLLAHPDRPLASLWRWTDERRLKTLLLATIVVGVSVACARATGALLNAVLPTPAGVAGTVLGMVSSVVAGGVAGLQTAGLVALVCWLSATAAHSRDGGAAPSAM